MEQKETLALEPYRSLDEFSLSDLELVRLILRGGSVLDWHLLNFSKSEALGFCRAHGIDPDSPDDLALYERIKEDAVDYLQESFNFPVPKPVRKATLLQLLTMASDSGNRHRQFCACIVLKAVHMSNHFDASEARQALSMTDQETFQAAERKIYRVVSQMMAKGLPVVEFLGGRKQRSSMMTKLLSKNSPLSAQLFDKLRFRVVTSTIEDVLPVINYLARNLFPFNYSLASESYNTLLPFATYCGEHPHLSKLVSKLQIDPDLENQVLPVANRHSSPEYRVIHWVADMPLKVPNYQTAYRTDGINPIPRPIIYVRTELQILDRRSHRQNEQGEASHESYKLRQIDAVANRLKLGLRTNS